MTEMLVLLWRKADLRTAAKFRLIVRRNACNSEQLVLQIALLWPFVHKEVVIGKHGKEEHDPVQLPKQVSR